MAVDFGTDVSAFPTLDPSFALITGNAVVAQAVARRLVTPAGSLFWDRDYGSDITALLSADVDDSRIFAIAAMVEAEALKDERVTACDVETAWNAQTGKLALTLELTTANGPFTAVMSVSAVTIEMLRVT